MGQAGKTPIGKRLVEGMMARLGLEQRPRGMADLVRIVLHQQILQDRCAHCGNQERCARLQAKTTKLDRPPLFCTIPLPMFRGDMDAAAGERRLRESLCGTVDPDWVFTDDGTWADLRAEHPSATTH